MKLQTLLLMPLIAFMICPTILADDIKKVDPIDARLRAIELRLDRIEHLLRASTAVATDTDDGSDRIKVTVLGQVNVPGVYEVDFNAPIGSLIALAGGYTHVADASHISVATRKGKKIKVNASKDPRAYKLKGGDIVTVGEGWF